jgi:multidrug efflux pump subunit AcrA (membrane-fusion protein)
MQSARAQAGAARALNSQGQVVAPSAGEVTRIPSPRGAVIMPGEVVVQITRALPSSGSSCPSPKLQT